MRRLAWLCALIATGAVAQGSALSFDAWKSLPLSAGSWIYAPTASGSEARFGNLLLLRCDKASRTVSIERPGAAPVALDIVTSSVSRRIMAGAKLSANDPLLDAIAFSRGRILISGGSGTMLAVPSWPEAARSIEDCRN